MVKKEPNWFMIVAWLKTCSRKILFLVFVNSRLHQKGKNRRHIPSDQFLSWIDLRSLDTTCLLECHKKNEKSEHMCPQCSHFQIGIFRLLIDSYPAQNARTHRTLFLVLCRPKPTRRYGCSMCERWNVVAHQLRVLVLRPLWWFPITAAAGLEGVFTCTEHDAIGPHWTGVHECWSSFTCSHPTSQVSTLDPILQGCTYTLQLPRWGSDVRTLETQRSL